METGDKLEKGFSLYLCQSRLHHYDIGKNRGLPAWISVSSGGPEFCPIDDKASGIEGKFPE